MYTQEELLNTIKKFYPESNIEILSFSNWKVPFSFKCLTCEKITTFSRLNSFSSKAKRGVKNICSFCDKVEQLKQKYENLNPQIKCVSPKNKVSEVFTWKCLNCNNIFEKRGDSFKANPNCPFCGPRKVKKLTIDIIKKRAALQWGDEYEIISTDYNFNNSQSDEIVVKHKCGYCYSVSVFNFLGKNKGCMKCATSSNEKRIRYFLEENNIDYQEQFPINYEGHNFRFDFCIFNKNKEPYALIEFYGGQHYFPVECFGGKQNLEKTKEYDLLKTNYCKENKIPLLVFSYFEEQSLETLLAQRLNELKILTTDTLNGKDIV